MSSPGDIESRLALLEAESAILKNLYRYGHAIDYGDEEAWVDCFTEDGVFDVRARLRTSRTASSAAASSCARS